MPRRKRQDLKPGDQVTMRSPLYHQHSVDDVKGKRAVKIVNITAGSNMTSYPVHIQGIYRNRMKRKGGMPFKIVKLSDGTWLPLSQVKIKRDNEYGLSIDDLKKLNKEENVKDKKLTTEEILRKIVRQETLKILKEEKIKTLPNYLKLNKDDVQGFKRADFLRYDKIILHALNNGLKFPNKSKALEFYFNEIDTSPTVNPAGE